MRNPDGEIAQDVMRLGGTEQRRLREGASRGARAGGTVAGGPSAQPSSPAPASPSTVHA
jgi:hypothetical protein